MRPSIEVLSVCRPHSNDAIIEMALFIQTTGKYPRLRKELAAFVSIWALMIEPAFTTMMIPYFERGPEQQLVSTFDLHATHTHTDSTHNLHAVSLLRRGERKTITIIIMIIIINKRELGMWWVGLFFLSRFPSHRQKKRRRRKKKHTHT